MYMYMYTNLSPELTAANNSLECESQVVKAREFLVASK